MLALLEEAGVVDDPGLDGLAARDGVDGVSGGGSAHGAIVPRGIHDEVVEALMGTSTASGSGQDRAAMGSMLFRSPSASKPSA